MKKIILLFSAIILLSCGEEKIKPEEAFSGNGERMPVQEIENSTIYFTEFGVTQAVLFSKKISVYDDDKTKFLESVKIDFYNDNNEISTVLTSLKGKIDDRTRNMYAIDSVVVVSDSGVVLNTDELVWRNKDSKIVTDKFVTIETPEELIEGYGFESDKNLRNYVIFDITYYTESNKNK